MPKIYCCQHLAGFFPGELGLQDWFSFLFPPVLRTGVTCSFWTIIPVLGAHGWAGSWRPLCRLLTCSLYLPQSVLKKRDQVQAEYEAKLEAVALRKEERPKVRPAPRKGWAERCRLPTDADAQP